MSNRQKLKTARSGVMQRKAARPQDNPGYVPIPKAMRIPPQPRPADQLPTARRSGRRSGGSRSRRTSR